MATAAILLADGFEEIEAITVIDVLRRADVQVLVIRVGLPGDAMGAHGIRVGTDRHLDDLTGETLDAVILPGGMPGSTNLRDSAGVRALLVAHAGAGRLTAAICAAPIALAAAGVINRRRVTCYPSCIDQLAGAVHMDCRVVEDGNIITAQGAGSAIDFALTLAARLTTIDKARQVRRAMLA